MGKSVSSIHLLNSTSEEAWSYICDISQKNKYHIDDDIFIADFFEAHKSAGLECYDENDSEMIARDIVFMSDYLKKHCVDHTEKFYVVQKENNASIFSSYFCFSEMEHDISRLFYLCPKNIIAVSMIDEDFLKIDFYIGANKQTSAVIGAKIEFAYGIKPAEPDTEVLARIYGIDWAPISAFAPDYMSMLTALSAQTGLPVDWAVEDLACQENSDSIEYCTFSLF